MKGESGHHQADALLANFTTVVAHCTDGVSAKWLASRLGKKKEILFGGSTSQGESAWDDLYGNSRFNGSFSERWEDVLQPQEFMVGRCGGPANGFLVDGVVVKSGEPFASAKTTSKPHSAKGGEKCRLSENRWFVAISRPIATSLGLSRLSQNSANRELAGRNCKPSVRRGMGTLK